MIPNYLLKDFVTLFAGRDDVYGSDSGGCVKERLTEDVFQQHFNGTAPIGIYPVVPLNGNHYVGWGCVDFDTAEAKGHAIALHDALAEVNIKSWIERSRSKGYHVWVFAQQPVLATTMRNMLLVASQVANTPTTEVNPKQTTLGVGSYGNYVRLPYANIDDRYTDKQRMIYRERINDWQLPLTPALLLDFVRTAIDTRVSVEVLESIAGMYSPPVKSTLSLEGIQYDASLDEAMQVLSPLGKVIWRDGPLAGKDRSSTLAKLGHESVRSGLNPSQTKIVLKTADRRWGKYHMRTNGEDEIDKLVVRVYS